MTNKVQIIREKVERLIEQTKPYLGACAGQVVAEANNKIAAYNEVLALLDTMQEEPVSEELDKAADDYAVKVYNDYLNNPKAFAEKDADELNVDIFKAGANWQKQQDNKDANHALVEQIKTQQMCYEKGMADMKQQMMKNSLYGEVTYGKSLAIPSLGYFLDEHKLDFGDKVKLIIIKED